jgi:hypothetical protein
MNYKQFRASVEAAGKLLTHLTREDHVLVMRGNATERKRVKEVFISALPESEQQSHTCNCCFAFLNQVGTLAAILREDYLVWGLWDLVGQHVPQDSMYHPAVEAMKAYCNTLPFGPVRKVETWTGNKVGTPHNTSATTRVRWEHFNFEVMRETKALLETPPSTQREKRDLFYRGLNEITPEAASTALELVRQGSLYRGDQYQAAIESFVRLQEKMLQLPAEKMEPFFWFHSGRQPESVVRIRNTAFGTLLQDLSEGMSVDKAVTRYEKVVAPANYKRTTALVTPAMLDTARRTLDEKGLLPALRRRTLTEDDINVNHLLWTNRRTTSAAAAEDPFEMAKAKTAVKKPESDRLEEIPIGKFVADVLPTTRKLRVFLDNNHLNNLMVMTGPVEETEPLFYWGNSFGWSFSGGVADSMKEKVRNAGGKVDGPVRISLAWYSHDDLDLHLKESEHHIHYARKAQGVWALDVDANSPSVVKILDPVENIAASSLPNKGEYLVEVNNYTARPQGAKGFAVEVETPTEVRTYFQTKSPRQGETWKVCSLKFGKSGPVTITDHIPSGTPEIPKWGLTTQKWVDCNLVCRSPKAWGRDDGTAHYMFVLTGATCDENPRPFYNEFFSQDLAPIRKAMELLAGTIQVERTPGELTGLGFAPTSRNHLVVEVEGAFKRKLKVLF